MYIQTLRHLKSRFSLFLFSAALMAASPAAGQSMKWIDPEEGPYPGMPDASSAKVEGTKAQIAELDKAADTTLELLLTQTPKAKDLMASSAGLIVFPRAWRAGLILGASGALGRVQTASGEILGYVKAEALSIGLQVGASSYSSVVLIQNPDALERLASDPWTRFDVGNTYANFSESSAAEQSKADYLNFVFDGSGASGGASFRRMIIHRVLIVDE